MIALAKPFSRSRGVFRRGDFRALRPRPKVRSWEWIAEHGRTPNGQPFNGERMPWAKGVCQAWDDTSIRKIVLMWGTRLGKTLVSHELMACSMATNPMPGLLAGPNEKLCTRTVRNKIYKILDHIRPTRAQLLPERLRGKNEIRLTDSVWPVVWSGSETMLADWPGFYGIAYEVDKWSRSESQEGDALHLFFERFKDSPRHKILVECSPSLKDKSRIEAEYLASDMRRYWVPCPHCKKRQVLKMGSDDPDNGGLKFDKTKDGYLDADLAERTARYICEHCHKPIHDEHRLRMMRMGVWAPAGCTVDKNGKLCGTPRRTCDVAGFHLSSLYSLHVRWGRIAREFVLAEKNRRILQNFVNGWLAETWEPYRVKSEPEDVAENLATEDPAGIMPKWSTWLFSSVDVQAEYFKWMKVAAGPNEQVAIVDRGICDTWAEVREHCIDSATPHEDGGPSLMPCLTLIDSGDGRKTDEVYQKCREWSRPDRLVIPCKGDNTDSGASYKKVVVLPEQHKSRTLKRQSLRAQGAVLIRVNSFWHEPIINRWLNDRKPGEFDSLSIPGELCDDIEFMRELCNGVQSDNPSKMNPDRLLWVKRWESEANDFRDCLKYCRCAIDVKFRGNWRVAERRQLANGQMAAVRQSAPSAPLQPEDEYGRRRARRRERLRERRGRTARR